MKAIEKPGEKHLRPGAGFSVAARAVNSGNLDSQDSLEA